MNFPNPFARAKKPASPFPEAELRKWYIDSGLSPEVYAAKRGHLVGCFSLDEYSYADTELQNWIYRFAEIYRSPELLDDCRKRYLTPGEYREAVESTEI